MTSTMENSIKSKLFRVKLNLKDLPKQVTDVFLLPPLFNQETNFSESKNIWFLTKPRYLWEVNISVWSEIQYQHCKPPQFYICSQKYQIWPKITLNFCFTSSPCTIWSGSPPILINTFHLLQCPRRKCFRQHFYSSFRLVKLCVWGGGDTKEPSKRLLSPQADPCLLQHCGHCRRKQETVADFFETNLGTRVR